MRYAGRLLATLLVAFLFVACAEDLQGPGRMEPGEGECSTGKVTVGQDPDTGEYFPYCLPADFD